MTLRVVLNRPAEACAIRSRVGLAALWGHRGRRAGRPAARPFFQGARSWSPSAPRSVAPGATSWTVSGGVASSTLVDLRVWPVFNLADGPSSAGRDRAAPVNGRARRAGCRRRSGRGSPRCDACCSCGRWRCQLSGDAVRARPRHLRAARRRALARPRRWLHPGRHPAPADGVLGARLLHVVAHWPVYRADLCAHPAVRRGRRVHVRRVLVAVPLSVLLLPLLPLGACPGPTPPPSPCWWG